MSDTYCNNCGHQNPAGANFCSSCGAVLESSLSEPVTITFFPGQIGDGDDEGGLESVELPGDVGSLVARRGPKAGSRYALDQPVTSIGRSPDSDIFLDDITVSRNHAAVERTAEGYVVRDTGSLNGTYVNRERVDEARLNNGDELQVGTFKLSFFDPSGGPGR